MSIIIIIMKQKVEFYFSWFFSYFCPELVLYVHYIAFVSIWVSDFHNRQNKGDFIYVYRKKIMKHEYVEVQIIVVGRLQGLQDVELCWEV